ncbi:14801_t:CDS:2, partial [Racocetra fulgida]
MPALSPTMTLGNVGTWRKQVGDSIEPGDVLVEIETDKAQMDFECQEEGYLAKILVESGEKNVNPIAILVEDNQDIKKFEDYVPEQSSTPTKAESAEKSEETSKQDIQKEEPRKQQEESVKSHASSDRILASPVARKLAAERGISLDQVAGTGPKNRIIKADILNFVPPAAEQPTPSKHAEPSSTYIDIPLTSMRKIIASRLSESKQSIPHYYLTIEVEVDKLLELREVLNKDSDGKYKISVNDFVIKSSASALMAMPEGLEAISKQAKELAVRAREGKLAPNEYQTVPTEETAEVMEDREETEHENGTTFPYTNDELSAGSNYHLFKKGIKPMWEDPANEQGGKWVIQFPRNKTGEEINTLWLYTVSLNPSQQLEFQPHSDSIKSGSHSKE